MSSRTPRLFTRGAPLWLRQSLYLLLALFAIVVDNHFHQLNVLRNIVYVSLRPFQAVANIPNLIVNKTEELFSQKKTLLEENQQLKLTVLKLSVASQDKVLLSKKLEELEHLTNIKNNYHTTQHISQVLYASHNPFHQRIMIDGGSLQDLKLGSPVVTEEGLIGQLTGLFPKSSEVTLISDKNLSIPVENIRTGYRTVTEGEGENDLFDLTYVPVTSDFKVGDELVTSGLGGIYPAGIPIGHVVAVTREHNAAYYKIQCQPNHIFRSGHYIALLDPINDVELTDKTQPLQAEPVIEKKKSSSKKKK